MADLPARRTALQRLLRIIRARPRLFLSAVIGFCAAFALPSEWRAATRMLVAWDIGALLYLGLTLSLMMKSDVARIKRRAALQDEGGVAILVIVVGAALASLGAIIAELGGAAHGENRQPHLGVAVATVLLSWALTHTTFALHYAHEHYDEVRGKNGGLIFPGNEAPDYLDFLYFSFVIGMTSQVSDIAISSRRIRRTATAHGVVSFVFNVTLLALTVNIAAGLI
jgi:uncharacterized membrane protein